MQCHILSHGSQLRQRKKERKREIKIERQQERYKDREKDSKRDLKIERNKERFKDRQKVRKIARKIKRQTERQQERYKDGEKYRKIENSRKFVTHFSTCAVQTFFVAQNKRKHDQCTKCSYSNSQIPKLQVIKNLFFRRFINNVIYNTRY